MGRCKRSILYKPQLMEDINILQPEEAKVVVNHMPVYIRSADRSFKDVGKWMKALEQAESTYYPNRTELIDIFSTVDLDGQLTGIVEKRIANVLNKPIYFAKNKQKIDALDALLKNERFR